MSFLSAIGGDIKKVFQWIASPKGQTVIHSVETGIEAAFPAATGAINLLNAWGVEIFKTEAIAAAAAATPGTDTNMQKAAAVLNVLTPQVLAYAQQYKLPAPTAATIATINTALVTALNALTGATATPAPAVPSA
jgi:hypothetical protein